MFERLIAVLILAVVEKIWLFGLYGSCSLEVVGRLEGLIKKGFFYRKKICYVLKDFQGVRVAEIVAVAQHIHHVTW
jgi:hypothetical protein